MSNTRYLNLNNFSYKIFFLFALLLLLSTVDIIPISVSYFLLFFNIILSVFLFFVAAKLSYIGGKDVLYVLLFIIPIYVSYLFNINSNPNIARFLLLVAFYPIVLLLLKYIVSKFDIVKILIPILISISLIILLSVLKSLDLFDFTFYGSDISTLDYYADVYSRDRLLAINGIYLNQNSFASILLVGFFSFFAFYTAVNNKIGKFLGGLFLFIISILLLLTLARAAIFSALIGVLIFYIFSNVKVYIKLFTIFLLSTLFFVFIFFTDYGVLFNEKINSAGMSLRDVIWKDVIYNFEKNKLFGVGLGNYQFISGYSVYSTHNLYLFFLISLGLFGVVGIFFSIILVFLKILNVLLFCRNDKLLLVFSSAILAIFVHQCFEVELDNPFKPLSFFFLLSLAYLFTRKKPELGK